jgi:hypothetical protein
MKRRLYDLFKSLIMKLFRERLWLTRDAPYTLACHCQCQLPMARALGNDRRLTSSDRLIFIYVDF